MVDAYIQAVVALFQPMTLFAILAGMIVGIVIGILPAIGGMVGCSLFLPFLWKMDPLIAMGFLIALQASTSQGGCITAILINIPGTNPNAATLLDGFPMNQNGEGGRAIGAALMSSIWGGVLPVFLALAMIPVIVPIVLAFRAPELFTLVLLGLSFLSLLSGDSPRKGLISGGLGLLFSLVGFQGLTGTHRFTFGSLFLYNGLELVAIPLGLFGLAEMVDMLTKGQETIAPEAVKNRSQGMSFRDVYKGTKDVYRHKLLWLRSAIIGYIVGMVPGIGAEVAVFVAYAQAKQMSKNPEKFGHGCVEGVIAPESASNAKEAGSLLTTMAFGIPGGALMAILMAGFLLVGVTPGPQMMGENLPLALTLLLGIALANLLSGLICLGAAPYLGRVSFVHIDFLFPVVLVLIMTGAFVVANSMLNIITVIVFGLLGLCMKRFGYSRPALLLGFVLGEQFEFYFFRSWKLFGPTFFMTPISLVMLVIIVVLFCYPYLRKALPRISRRLRKI